MPERKDKQKKEKRVVIAIHIVDLLYKLLYRFFVWIPEKRGSLIVAQDCLFVTIVLLSIFFEFLKRIISERNACVRSHN